MGKSKQDDRISTEEELRRRVKKRIEKSQEELIGLISHAMAYFFFNFVVFINLLPAMAAMIIMVSWGIGLVSHGLDYYNKYGPGRERRERLIQREVEKERERLMMFEKAKNDFDDRPVRLTDDGELEYDDHDDTAGKRYDYQ